MTRANQATAIAEAVAQEPWLRLHPVFLDLPFWARFWKRGRRGLRIYYLLWQALAWYHARRLHRLIGFQVAHHITFATDWMVAGVAWVTGPAFIWGPVGGSPSVPPRLWRWLGWRGCVGLAVRQVITTALRRVVTGLVVRRAAVVVAQNDDVARRLRGHPAVIIEPNIALVRSPPPSTKEPAGPALGRPRVAVFAGRLMPSKGLRLALAAMGRPGSSDWVLHVYGDGRERGRLEKLARRLGVHDRVVFHGHRPRDEVMAALQRADALLFLSMQEGAPWTVAEALSVGCPVVCLEVTAPALLVQEGEGSKVPLDGDLVQGVATALAGMTVRPSPAERWAEDRLPGLLGTWYAAVSGGLPAAAGRLSSGRPTGGAAK